MFAKPHTLHSHNECYECPEVQQLVSGNRAPSYQEAEQGGKRCNCDVHMCIRALIPLCLLLDLVAIWQKNMYIFIAAVSTSLLLCISSTCIATVFIVLQTFIAIYYHSYVMNGVHFNMHIAALKI